ncbi:MAG: helix-turn-helix domain-containing protein [Haloferacaceae archaeon]
MSTPRHETPGGGTSIGKLLADDRELHARLAISLPDDHPCPLSQAWPGVLEVERTLTEDECHLVTKVARNPTGDASPRYMKSCIDEACFCTPFTDYDSVAVIRDATDEEVVVETYPPDRLALVELVDDLSEIGDVEVRRLALTDGSAETQQLETVDVSQLTELERETVRWAIEHGYYERDREIGLDELAEEFDVSKSTISQRLQSAERKLVSEAMR